MVMISDLRYDLASVDELKHLNIDLLPDAMVVLLHDQISTINHERVPTWLVSLVTTWLALETNAAQDYQDTIAQKDALIAELQARLGYGIDISGYAQAGD